MLGRPTLESSIDKLDAREGELGNGGTLGAILVGGKLFWELPVGEVGEVPFGGRPGLLEPLFLPPPRNRPLL